ncbi:PucR family transcriptional regulator, partial [Streptomyces hygroscopicus]|uniref:PucR family transcriptional regulator n=1 Tax=Streptomyces hygroscopicus TaxID=1912 RepID=UPI0036875C45
AARRAARLVTDVERLRSRPGPASIVVGGGGGAGATGAEPAEDTAVADRVELQSLGTGRRTRGVLAVGTGAPLGTAERYAVHSAVALLTLTTERSRALREAEQRLGAAVLRMLLAGEPDHARAVAGRLYGGLLDAPFRMLVAEVPSGGAARQARTAPSAADEAPAPAQAPADAATAGTGTGTGTGVGMGIGQSTGSSGTGAVPGTGPGTVPGAGAAVGEPEPADPLATLADTMEAAAARTGESVLVVPDGERLIVLASDGGSAVEACAEHARAVESRRGTKARPRGRGAAAPHGDELVIGLSAPAGPIAAAAAYRQAEQALSVARRRGRMLVEHEQVAAGSVLPLLADDAVRAFADGMLRALYEHDATGRGDLVASLRAWLSRHGQWDAAAADLGVHRHTLRYRMRRVEEILGRSLDDPDVRMELWLALKATASCTST